MINRSALCVFMCVLVASPIVLADPSIQDISGKYDDGASITVFGSEFGGKAAASPLKFEKFESRPPGSLIGSEGYWHLFTDNIESERAVYSTENSRTGASPTTAKFTINTLHDYAIRSGLDFSSGRVFFDYWVRFKWGSTGTHQIKLARLGSGTNDHYVYPHFVTEHWIGGSGCYSDARLGPGCPGGADTDWDYNCPPVNKWHHVQIAIDIGDPGAGNSLYHIWQDGAYRGGDENFSWYCPGDPIFQQVWIGAYLGNAGMPLTTTIYYDDVYFDNNWARVEIGNDPVYNNCTHRETQVPTAWSANTVSATVNVGSFDPGEQAYLFVVDSQGRASAGHPITIGARGSDNEPPSLGILLPTSSGYYETTDGAVDVSGSSYDADGIASITWVNDRGGSGTADDDSGDWTAWSIASIALQAGQNVVSVTAENLAGWTATEVIVIDYDEGPPGEPPQPIITGK